MAPTFVLATTTLAPPRGSPVSEVTLPLMTASCAANGAAVNVSVTSAAATLVTSSVPNLRTRISCLSCEEGTRMGRHVLQWHSNVYNPLGPRPTAERDGPTDFGGSTGLTSAKVH